MQHVVNGARERVLHNDESFVSPEVSERGVVVFIYNRGRGGVCSGSDENDCSSRDRCDCSGSIWNKIIDSRFETVEIFSVRDRVVEWNEHGTERGSDVSVRLLEWRHEI